MTAPDPAFVATGNHPIAVLVVSFSVGSGTGVVRLADQIDVFCYAPEQARDIAQAFTQCAELIEARQREATHTETLDAQP